MTFDFSSSDTHAHVFGPESDVITDLIAQLNNVTEHIHRKIKKHGLENRVNVIHLSDHGMDSLELRNVINLTKIIGNDEVKFYGSTPVLQIVPENMSKTDEIYNKLKAEAKLTGNFRVYTESTLQERWHFRNKVRTGPITVVADLGFGFQDMFQLAEWYRKYYNVTPTPTTKYGVHGYDNTYESMHPVFFAYGPRIKTQHVVEPFETVDLIYLFCEILGLEVPSYVKGNREHILDVLKDSEIQKLSRWFVISKFKKN